MTFADAVAFAVAVAQAVVVDCAVVALFFAAVNCMLLFRCCYC